MVGCCPSPLTLGIGNAPKSSADSCGLEATAFVTAEAFQMIADVFCWPSSCAWSGINVSAVRDAFDE